MNAGGNRGNRPLRGGTFVSSHGPRSAARFAGVERVAGSPPTNGLITKLRPRPGPLMSDAIGRAGRRWFLISAKLCRQRDHGAGRQLFAPT